MPLPICDARMHGSISSILACQLRQNKNLTTLATAAAACAIKAGPTAGAQGIGLVIAVIILITVSSTARTSNGRYHPSTTGIRPARR